MNVEDIKKMKVGELQSLDRGVVAISSVPPSSKVKELYNVVFMNPHKLALVVDDNKLVGVVGKTDLAKAASTQIDPQINVFNQTTKSYVPIVNTNPTKIYEANTVGDLLSTLLGKDLDHIVVCDKDDKPVGVIDRVELAHEIRRLGM